MHNKYKFILGAMAVALLPCLIVSAHFLSGSRALRKSDTLRLFEMRTAAGARIVAGEMGARYNLGRLAADPKFSAAGGAARKAALEARLKDSPGICYELALLGPDGKVRVRVTASRDGKPAPDYAGGRVLEGARESGLQAGAVEFGDYTPPALVLAAPLGEGGRNGFVAGRLSLAYVGEVVRALGRNSAGSLGLMDAGGQLIADSANVSTMRPGAAAPGAVAALAAAALDRGVQNMSREVFSGGGSTLVSVSAVPGTAWWVYETMDASRVPYGHGRARLVLLSCFGLVVLAGFASYDMARRWLLPYWGAPDGGDLL